MENPTGPVRSGSGMRAGIILIIIGVVLLAVQLIPGINIFMLWPLFIIVPGVVQCVTPDSGGWSARRFFEGLVTIAIGAIFLANTTGYLPWDVWWQVLQLWPVLLISAGLGLLGKALHQEIWQVLGSVAVLAALAFAVTNAPVGEPFGFVGTGMGKPFAFGEPAGTVQNADLKLSAGAGEVQIGTGDELISIEGRSPFSEPQFTTAIQGTTADIDFELTGEGDFVVYPGGGSARVNAGLSDDVVWDIQVDSGVSALKADLSRVPVKSMRLKTGVSSNNVTLGDVPVGVDQATLSIDSGISSIRVLVPNEAQVRIESQSGLTGHDVSPELESQGGRIWQTPGYDQAVRARSGVWTITVKSGIGSVTVDTY